VALTFSPEALERARIAAGFTRTDLANRTGIPLRSIHNYESGLVGSPKMATVVKLATILSVELLDLYETAEVA